jgi:DNA-binding winged helix-turn-helix (wHTH) protein
MNGEKNGVVQALNPSSGIPPTTPAMLGLDLDKNGFVYYRSAPLPLAPTARAVLQLLLREWPAVVGKQQFAHEVWDGVMSDESLARCMTQLRGVLAGVPGLKIRAAYGEGYQLQVTDVAAVTPQFHLRLRDTAMAAPALAETLMHARTLIQQYTPSSLLRAEDLLRGLMEHAPDYVSAKIAFGESLAAQVSSGMGLRPDRLEEGLKLLNAAAAQAPDAVGLWSQKAHLLDCAWRFDEAAPLHRKALQTGAADPATHHHHAWHLLACGHFAEAVSAMEKAHALAPYECGVTTMLARTHTFADTPEVGMTYARKAYADHPDNLQAYIHLLAYKAYLEPRADLVDKFLAIKLGPRSWSFAASSIAYGLARCGATEAAAAIVARHDADNPSMRATFTSVLLLLGDTDAAHARVVDAAELGCGFLPVSMRAPENRQLGDHPGYADVAGRVFGALPADARP